MADRIMVDTENGRLWFTREQAIGCWHIVEPEGFGQFSKLYRLSDGRWVHRGPLLAAPPIEWAAPHGRLIGEDDAVFLLLEHNFELPEDLQEKADRLNLLNATKMPIRKRRAAGRKRGARSTDHVPGRPKSRPKDRKAPLSNDSPTA